MAQSPDEKTYVEIPLVEQSEEMGWEHIKRLKVAFTKKKRTDCGHISQGSFC